jgi:hypothetical protein
MWHLEYDIRERGRTIPVKVKLSRLNQLASKTVAREEAIREMEKICAENNGRCTNFDLVYREPVMVEDPFPC